MARLCRCCPNLTYRQRLLGFAVCFIFGGLLSLSALNSLPSLLLGNPAPFAFKCDAPLLRIRRMRPAMPLTCAHARSRPIARNGKRHLRGTVARGPSACT